jgi:hypothetical protein
MRCTITSREGNLPNSKPSGYTLWVSTGETLLWANRTGANWPYSTLAGNRLVVSVDLNGLCNFTINGKFIAENSDIDGNELIAIISDFIRERYPHLAHLWPCWQ